MRIDLLLIAALLGVAPKPAIPDADPTPAIFAAVAAELATQSEGERRRITIDPRWLSPFPLADPDAGYDLARHTIGTEPMATELHESLRARLPGIEFCEEVLIEHRCIRSAGTAHLTFARPEIEGSVVRLQVLFTGRHWAGRSLTFVEIWIFTVTLDGDRASVVNREPILRGHSRIPIP